MKTKDVAEDLKLNFRKGCNEETLKMAIKDWKLIENNYGVKDWIRYKNQKFVGWTIEISRNTKKNSFIIYQNNRNHISVLKENLKTKSQAIKYAKAYMRKH